MYSKFIVKTFPDIQQPAFYKVIESPPRILLLRRATKSRWIVFLELVLTFLLLRDGIFYNLNEGHLLTY